MIASSTGPSAWDVLIAVPTRGDVQWQTVVRLNEIRDAAVGLAPIYFHKGALSVARTRNQIVRRFMASDKQVLVMVDDDVVPPLGLLDIVPYLGEFGMVGIPYPLWDEANGLFLSVFDRDPAGWKPRGLSDGMNWVDAVGGGCVAISRLALDALGRDPFRFDDSDYTEDFIFCDDLHAAGFKIGAWWRDAYADHVRVAGLAAILNEKRALLA